MTVIDTIQNEKPKRSVVQIYFEQRHMKLAY